MIQLRKGLTLKERVSLLDDARQLGYRELAKKYGISVGAVSGIIKNKDVIETAWASNAHADRIRLSRTPAFDAIDKTHGRCDVLVNGAGIAKLVPFIDYPLDTFLKTMQINVTGAFLCSQHAARLMVKNRWGRIINIASVAGMRAVGKGRTAYGTSKGAVIALTRQMAVELCDYGITANAIAPGPVDTPMTKALHSEEFRAEYANAIPMKRYGTTSEIAAAVCYLASEEAGYTNGIVLPVDGGFLAWGAGAV